MSYAGWSVLAAIDRVFVVREKDPVLFALLHRKDRTCLALVRAADRKRVAKRLPVGGRAERDEVERVPVSVEVEFAERNGQRSMRQRRTALNDLREQRAATSLPVRLQAALAELGVQSTVPASRIGYQSKDSESTGLPRSQEVDLQKELRMLEMAVRRIESRADEIAGRGAHREIGTMSTEEKDAIIRDELVGWTPADVESYYEGELGAVRHIEQKRRTRFGQYAHNGAPDPERFYEPESKQYMRRKVP